MNLGRELTLLTGESTLLDDDDYLKFSKVNWRKSKSGYVVRSKRIGKNCTKVFLHRLVMGDPKGHVVDHINGNKLDNRKENLRVCTHQENMFNHKLSSNNTSGFPGVVWDRSRNKWIAQIMVNRRHMHLGRYDNKEDAINARRDGEAKYHRGFSRSEECR